MVRLSCCDYKPAWIDFTITDGKRHGGAGAFDVQSFSIPSYRVRGALAGHRHRRRTAISSAHRGLRTNALVALGASAFVDLGMRLNAMRAARKFSPMSLRAWVSSGGVILKEA